MNKSIGFGCWRLGSIVLVIILSLGLLRPTEAQESSKTRRVGHVPIGTEESTRKALDLYRAVYADLGYLEGKNLRIDVRYAEGHFERGPQLFKELIDAGAEVLVTGGYQLAAAALQVTRNVPVVGIGCGIELLAASLSRPSGNLTGVTCQTPDLATKHLEIFFELLPGERQVVLLYNPEAIYTRNSAQEIRRAAADLGIEMPLIPVRQPEEIEFVFAELVRQGKRAIILVTDALLYAERQRLVALATTHRIALVATFREFADQGALVSYGSNITDLNRRAAGMVVKILKGAKPADIPIEQPTRFELIINLKTARALGLDIPPRSSPAPTR